MMWNRFIWDHPFEKGRKIMICAVSLILRQSHLSTDFFTPLAPWWWRSLRRVRNNDNFYQLKQATASLSYLFLLSISSVFPALPSSPPFGCGRHFISDHKHAGTLDFIHVCQHNIFSWKIRNDCAAVQKAQAVSEAFVAWMASFNSVKVLGTSVCLRIVYVCSLCLALNFRRKSYERTWFETF